MQNILIDQIRIDGFRGLKDFKMSLSETTILTGMNNVGKTSVLKALQLLFGNGAFLSVEDLHIDENNEQNNCIIVDAKIVAIDENGNRVSKFSEEWEIAFGEANIKFDENGFAILPLRVTYSYQVLQNSYSRELKVLDVWETNTTTWQKLKGKKATIKGECFQFYYLDAKRDIQLKMIVLFLLKFF